MKKLLASVLCAAMALATQPVNLAAAATSQSATGQISGRALVDGKPLVNVRVRLRNVDTSQVVGETRSGRNGEFMFTGLGPGNFVVEIVDDRDKVLGLIRANLTSAAMVLSNLTVSTTGAVLGTAVAGGGLAGAFTSTAGLLLIGAGLVTTTAFVVSSNNASPNQ